MRAVWEAVNRPVSIESDSGGLMTVTASPSAGDCVYIMQGDMVKAAQEVGMVPYKYVKELVPEELLIFRVEKLWKDDR